MSDQFSTPGEESVFIAMRRQIELAPTASRHHLPRGGTWARPRLIAAGTGAMLVAIVAAIATGLFASTPPAFAVTTTASTVTITLHDVAYVTPLNAKLAAEHLPIRVVPIVAGCNATTREPEANGTAGPSHTLVAAGRASVPIGSLTIELQQPPPAGDTLIVAISSDGRWGMFYPHEVVGPAPSCVAPAT